MAVPNGSCHGIHIVLVTLFLFLILFSDSTSNKAISRRTIDNPPSLIGRKFFIRRRDDYTSASLVQVQQLSVPTDGIPRLKLITLSNHQVKSSNDPEQYIQPDDDYMLTIEELSRRTEEAVRNQDLVPINITDHKSNGLQPVVLVTWNTNEQTWELVSDMKTHYLSLLMKYVKDRRLEDLIP